MRTRWVLTLWVAVAAAGCATNRERADGARSTARATDRSPDAQRRGYATWGSAVRLREDTPPYFGPAQVATAEPRGAYDPGASGPVDVGETGPTGAWGPTSGGGNAFGPWGPGGYAGGYLAPGGAVPGDLRPPPPPEPPRSPFAGPYRAAFPGSDVMDHRPGLSTGSGVYARPDPVPVPPPQAGTPPAPPKGR